ncbi:MAG: AAA family ATPase [Deltaproteobacteria bacterium]|nr:AAA family ATPase [Deltaproteobacteria bacterium]
MQLVFDFPPKTRYTFENFVVCGGNRAAYHFARQLAEGRGNESLLYLYGPSGCGKTHLLASVGSLLSTQTGQFAPYISFRDIDQLYQGNYPSEGTSLLGERFAGAPALLIDDIHLIPDNASVRVEVWQLFNDFYGAGKKILVTGLYPPKELPNLDDHLISRLLWGLVAGMDITDDESRRMILSKLAEDRQVILPGDVAEYILKNVRRDVPSLLDALEKISRYALSESRKITLRLAREVLAPSR